MKYVRQRIKFLENKRVLILLLITIVISIGFIIVNIQFIPVSLRWVAFLVGGVLVVLAVMIRYYIYQLKNPKNE